MNCTKHLSLLTVTCIMLRIHDLRQGLRMDFSIRTTTENDDIQVTLC